MPHASSDAGRSGTVADFGSCGIGSRGASDSDIGGSGAAATFGPFGVCSHGSSDADCPTPEHCSSDSGGHGIDISGAVAGRGGGRRCARGG
jgi:hypothetical protein